MLRFLLLFPLLFISEMFIVTTVNGASCQPGQYTKANACTDCPVGRYTDDLNTLTTCKRCPNGYEQDTIGKQFCLPCAAGKYAAGAVAGYNVDMTAGATQCTVCEPGRHQKNMKSTTCVVSNTIWSENEEVTNKCFHPIHTL